MKRKVFTLIELLVTIAIVAILASMLLPALNKVRDKAKGINCVNNLKQLGTAMGFYTDDSNEFIPPGYYSSHVNSSQTAFWPGLLIGQGYIKGNIFVCPSKLYQQDWWKVSANATVDYSAGFKYPAYSYNKEIGCRNDVPTTSAAYGKGVKLSEVKSTSATIMLADAYLGSLPERGYYLLNPAYIYVGAWGQLEARHSDNVNVLWLDGHASSQKVNILKLSPPYSADINPYMNAPFTSGAIRGAIDNHWDRF